jgi:hypothetical protein
VILGESTPGEPTLVTVIGDYALVAMDASPDLSSRREVQVLDIATPALVTELSLRCQPDTLVGSPDHPPRSQNGGNVQVSDIAALGGGSFLASETDDQSGPDAAIKEALLLPCRARRLWRTPGWQDVGKRAGPRFEGHWGIGPRKGRSCGGDNLGEAWINTNDDSPVSRAGKQELILLTSA